MHDAPALSPVFVVVALLVVVALSLLVVAVAVGLDHVVGLLTPVYVGCLHWLMLPGYDVTSDCSHCVAEELLF